MNFDWSDATYFANQFQVPYITVLIGYVPTVMLLQFVMRYIPPLNVDTPLKLWNATLSGLSLCGFTILCQRLILIDFIHSITSLDYSSGLIGYVVFLFNLSKILELVDTLFIVVRKKELTFLHVVHHLSVAIYCYTTLLYPTPLGYWYALMNTLIHSIMYGYFAFGTTLRRYADFNPMYLTIVQILQMVWGLSLNIIYLLLPTTRLDSLTIYHTYHWFKILFSVLVYIHWLQRKM